MHFFLLSCVGLIVALSNILLARLTPHVSEIIGNIGVGSVVIVLLRNRFSTFGRY
jgi:hypothetical protein